jgi:excisionase family DNA binding protein
MVEEPVLEAASSEAPLGFASKGSLPAIPLVLTVPEVARLLRVNVKTVYAATASGEIPGGRKIGRILRFYGPAVTKWLETGTGAGRKKLRR